MLHYYENHIKLHLYHGQSELILPQMFLIMLTRGVSELEIINIVWLRYLKMNKKHILNHTV